jgi:enoyl-CoA hydratase/carnithine racemase
MILTAEPITASEACALGLVNDVVPHERLLEAAFALARKIAGKSPLAVAACLASVTRGINVPIDEGLAIEANHFARMVPTRDIEEGLSAWLEQRKPQFTVARFFLPIPPGASASLVGVRSVAEGPVRSPPTL